MAEVLAPDRVCPGTTFDVTASETTGLPNGQTTWEISGCGSFVGTPTNGQATVEATEEAIVNVMVAAETTVGINGLKVVELPKDQLKAIFAKK